MTLNAKPRMDVVKREDKEAKLKNFISDYLTTESARASAAPWLLIARSVESPVVLALSSLAEEIKAAGLSIKTVLTQVAAPVPDSTAQFSLGLPCELRLARDIRLLDAHETLWLDRSTSWVGDCMRREPAKRDAYECYAANCDVTSNWSAKAFERLWERSEPVMMVDAASVDTTATAAAPELDACVSQATQIPSTIVASTRH